MDTTPFLPTPSAPAIPTPIPSRPKPKIPLGVLVVGVIVVAAAVGYTLGRVRSTPPTTLTPVAPAAPVATPTAPTTPAPEPGAAPQVGEQVPLSAAEVNVGNSTLVSGTIAGLTSGGFSVRAVTRTINTVNGSLGEQVKLYNVKLNAATKLMRYTTTVTVPATGGTPNLVLSTAPLKQSGLVVDQAVTVTGTGSATALQATEVRVSVVVRK